MSKKLLLFTHDHPNVGKKRHYLPMIWAITPLNRVLLRLYKAVEWLKKALDKKVGWISASASTKIKTIGGCACVYPPYKAEVKACR